VYTKNTPSYSQARRSTVALNQWHQRTGTPGTEPHLDLFTKEGVAVEHSTLALSAPKPKISDPNFPLEVHDCGKWSGEIDGETHLYFAAQNDPEGEIAFGATRPN
jgi:hypothetical protein